MKSDDVLCFYVKATDPLSGLGEKGTGIMIQKLEIANIKSFGITCKILCEEDLPLIVKWRNIDEIRMFMEDDRLVSKSTIDFWFSKIRNKNIHIPYIVKKENKPCGYMEIKNIDYAQKIGEFGIFLFGNKYVGTGIAERIALCWEIIMSRIGVEVGLSRIHVENTRSINYFRKIGGEFNYQDGNFLVFKHPLAKRRKALEKIASALHVRDEFFKALDVDLNP